MIIYIIILFAIAIITFFLFIYYIFKDTTPKLKELEKKGRIMKLSIFILFLSCLIIGLTLNYTNDLIDRVGGDKGDFSKIGAYGDLIGGILNPVVAFVGIMAAFLAFYVQYRANKQVQEQFNLQKFESQFYEMIRMHRENLNEMKIEGYKFDYDSNGKAEVGSKKEKETSGKKIFVTMISEFESIYEICKKSFYSYHSNNKEILSKFEAKQLIFDHSYYVFFNGVSFYSKNINRYIEEDKTEILKKKLLKKYIKELKEKRREHEEQGIKKYDKYNEDKTLWLSFNFRPFSGHQAILAHYYRHLYQTVKFVVKQDEGFISYENKRDYLRILRSMLSNHEQILLYYNWLSGFGSNWELKHEEIHLNQKYNKTKNKFFTDYRMIHNIPNQMVISEFSLKEIFKENYLMFRYEENRKEEDSLFELIDIISNLK